MTAAAPLKPWQRLIRKLTQMLVAAVVMIAALVIALLALARSATSDRHSLDASREAKAAAAQAQTAANNALAAISQVKAAVACVNGILGTRSPLTTSDTDADNAFYAAVVRVFADEPGSKQQLADAAALKQQAITTYRIRSANQADRVKHPLGAC